jgi:AraC-like DNA-binding protein
VQTLILLLLIVSLCILAMGSTVYLLARNAIRQEVQNAYQVSLLRTKDRIESYFRQMHQSILQFEKLPTFGTLSSPYKEEDQFDFITLRDTMLRIQTSLDYVDNIVLYRTATGKLLSTNQPVTDFQDDYSLAMQTFDPLGKDFAFLTVTVKSAPTAVLIRKLPVFSSTHSFYIIFHINQRFFDDILGQAGKGKGNYFILDEHKRLLQNRGTLSDGELGTKIVPGIADPKAAAPEGYFTSQLASSTSDWTYGFAIANDLLFHKIGQLRNGIFLFALLLLIVGAVAAVLSANRLWRGWNDIVSALNEQGHGQMRKHEPKGTSASANTGTTMAPSDEFKQIFLKVKDMKETRDELQEQVKELIPDIREAFVRKVLEKGVRTAEELDKLHKYQLPLDRGPYGCLCVEIDQYRSMSELYSEVDMYYFQYGLSRVILEVMEGTGIGAVSAVGAGRFIGVLTFETCSVREAKDALWQAANMIRTFVHDYFPYTVSIGTGRIREDLAYLNLAAQEAEEALKHKLLAGANRVISMEELGEASDIGDTAVFMKELHNDLLFAIRSRNRELGYAYVGKLTSLQNIKSLNAQRLQGQLAELVFSVFRGTGEQLNQPQNEPLLSELLKLSTLEEWMDWIRRETIDVLIDRVSQVHLSYMNKVAAQISGYLEEHNEEEIRLESCCKAMNLPVSIGKQALKEVHDTTFADLLLTSRMNKAQQLLKDTDTGIEEIASRLLYSSAQNFSRTFKKAIGIPPGQFRKESRE